MPSNPLPSEPVYIYYTFCDQQLELNVWLQLMRELPVSLQHKARKYRRWQDQQAFVFGKLLLKKALKQFSYGEDCLEQLKTNPFNKPILPNIQFNITHAGHCVICALSKHIPIGVDIEQIKEIDINMFDKVFCDQELSLIREAADPLYTFFSYWTIKEAILKCLGLGFSGDPMLISINRETVFYRNERWTIEKLSLPPNYIGHLAYQCSKLHLVVIKEDFVCLDD